MAVSGPEALDPYESLSLFLYKHVDHTVSVGEERAEAALFDPSNSDTLLFLMACSCLPEAVKSQPPRTADTSCHLCKPCKIGQAFATSSKSLIPLACFATLITRCPPEFPCS